MSGLRPFFHRIRCFVTKMSGLCLFSCCLLFCYEDVRAPPLFSWLSLFCYEDVRALPLFLLLVVLLRRCPGSAPFLVACCFVMKMSGLCLFSCCLLFCYEDVRAPPLFSWHSLFCYEDVRTLPLFLLLVVLLRRCQGSAPCLVACFFLMKMSGLCLFSCCLLFCYEDVTTPPL